MPNRRHTRIAAVAVTIAVGTVVSACGGSDPAAGPPRLTVLPRDGGSDAAGVVAATTTTLVGTRRYTIQPGDTLAAIAAAQGTTVADISTLNRGIDPTNLKVGSTLLLPPLPEPPTTAPPAPTAPTTIGGVTGATPQPPGVTSTTG